MTALPDIARHWLSQTEKGKGIRLDADAMDILNAIGFGELLATEAAKYQREQCRNRSARNRSFRGESSGSTRAPAEAMKSSGMTRIESGKEALARARQTSVKPRRD